ncbi:hypothetical protein LEP1GSC086_4379 [Leptospira weilii str. LNT 1234]|nr:hypothetical protein LEP1GSC086_4379 [Leptospira weilii str. LNT 1234]
MVSYSPNFSYTELMLFYSFEPQIQNEHSVLNKILLENFKVLPRESILRSLESKIEFDSTLKFRFVSQKAFRKDQFV